jgi:hypothetical protein
MIVISFNAQKYYSHQNLKKLGLAKSKFPYNNFEVYIKNQIFYLFKKKPKLINFYSILLTTKINRFFNL